MVGLDRDLVGGQTRPTARRNGRVRRELGRNVGVLLGERHDRPAGAWARDRTSSSLANRAGVLSDRTRRARRKVDLAQSTSGGDRSGFVVRGSVLAPFGPRGARRCSRFDDARPGRLAVCRRGDDRSGRRETALRVGCARWVRDRHRVRAADTRGTDRCGASVNQHPPDHESSVWRNINT